MLWILLWKGYRTWFYKPLTYSDNKVYFIKDFLFGFIELLQMLKNIDTVYVYVYLPVEVGVDEWVSMSIYNICISTKNNNIYYVW